MKHEGKYGSDLCLIELGLNSVFVQSVYHSWQFNIPYASIRLKPETVVRRKISLASTSIGIVCGLFIFIIGIYLGLNSNDLGFLIGFGFLIVGSASVIEFLLNRKETLLCYKKSNNNKEAFCILIPQKENPSFVEFTQILTQNIKRNRKH